MLFIFMFDHPVLASKYIAKKKKNLFKIHFVLQVAAKKIQIAMASASLADTSRTSANAANNHSQVSFIYTFYKHPNDYLYI